MSVLNDGRQSEAAREIWRGTARLLREMGWSCVAELGLSSGQRADLIALSHRGDIWIVEIKSCLEDFRADAKWHNYSEYCDRFFFAVRTNFPLDILPVETGLIIADRFGAELARDAPETRLPAARRKAVTLRFARTAALRLHSLIDPDPLG